MNLVKTTLTAILILLPVLVAAQGFNSRNARNHPELEWRVAETDHFLIMYPRHLSGLENRAAPVAEASWAALSENLEVEFDEKIRIYLSDEDEISNGFAVPAGNGYTNIWVDVNEYAEIWTGEVKWLRKVIAHELAHIFHYQATRTKLGTMGYLLGDPIPSFWTEGLAQYQTERWDAQRGDRWLRLAVFDDQLGYSGSSAVNGRLRYALGHSQVRYFTEVYGDTTLADLLATRQKRLGLLPVHDFRESFAAATGVSYPEFYDEWQKHVNIYYNTLAGKMERVDSLQGKVDWIPGQFIHDVAVSPDEKRTAVLSIPSVRRPVRRLYLVTGDSVRSSRVLAEGSVLEGIAWHPAGDRLAYARQVRGEHGSLLPDLFLLDTATGREERVTRSRRARYPVFSPTGDTLAFVVNEGGTANIWLRDLSTGREDRVTDYTGDLQLIHLVWNRQRNQLVYVRFDGEGNRHLVVRDLSTGGTEVIGSGAVDNRKPVIGPTGRRIAFTSLRDEVPNVFVHDLDTGTTERVTRLFAGGEAVGWLQPSPGFAEGRLLVKATESKDSESVWLADAGRRPSEAEPEPPAGYAGWRSKSPPAEIPWQISADSAAVADRYDYRPLSHLTHAFSVALPWVESRREFGMFAMTSWYEPLGKHLAAGGGYLSFVNPLKETRGAATYINNTLAPTLTFSLFRMPGAARWYRSEFLVEELTGGEFSAEWPLTLSTRSWEDSRLRLRLRHLQVAPLATGRFAEDVPRRGVQSDLQAGWIYKRQKPWSGNAIHPLDGNGLRFTLTGAGRMFGGDTQFLRADLGAFAILPSVGQHRLFLRGRVQAETGETLPQDFIGFSTYDNIDFPLPWQAGFLFESDVERVRGYRSFIAGRQVLFGSAEYRIPLLPSLQTEVLGLISLGQTTAALFADGGVVGNPYGGENPRRLGAGAELKNRLRLGPLSLTHAFGIAQPARRLFGGGFHDVYYRIRAVVPF